MGKKRNLRKKDKSKVWPYVVLGSFVGLTAISFGISASSSVDIVAAQALAEEGNVHFRAHRNVEAEQLYRQALEANPRYAYGYQQLAGVLSNQDRIDEAMEYVETALSYDPRLPDAHNFKGQMLTKKKSPEAIKWLQKAVELQGTDARFHYAVGKELKRLNRDAEAVPYFQTAFALDPKNPLFEHALTSMTDTETVETRASPEYVKHEFDQFASTFDKTLSSLQYNGPEKVAEALEKYFVREKKK